MNKNFATILTTAVLGLATGCATAGTWVNGYYIDGPLCTVCDGMRIVNHAYGTTVCSHCDGTGIEPPEETVVENTVIVDTWCAPPPPPPHRHHHPHPVCRPNPPHRHGGGGHHGIRPARPAGGTRPRPATRPAVRNAARPNASGGGRRGGGRGRR